MLCSKYLKLTNSYYQNFLDIHFIKLLPYNHGITFFDGGDVYLNVFHFRNAGLNKTMPQKRVAISRMSRPIVYMIIFCIFPVISHKYLYESGL